MTRTDLYLAFLIGLFLGLGIAYAFGIASTSYELVRARGGCYEVEDCVYVVVEK